MMKFLIITLGSIHEKDHPYKIVTSNRLGHSKNSSEKYERVERVGVLALIEKLIDPQDRINLKEALMSL